ncbi:MAG: helix-turn-helix domain-containing protein [Chloroflexota bacterium]|nr:helix-turn-helix domain-containing protein [Chloroflexota bacterium]
MPRQAIHAAGRHRRTGSDTRALTDTHEGLEGRSALGQLVPNGDYSPSPVIEDALQADQKYLKVFIRRLHHKLGDDPKRPRYIQSIRGTGYRFAPPG